MVSEKEETLLLFFKPHQSIFFNLRERERERERERKRERETSIICLSYIHQPGTEPTT